MSLRLQLNPGRLENVAEALVYEMTNDCGRCEGSNLDSQLLKGTEHSFVEGELDRHLVAPNFLIDRLGIHGPYLSLIHI